MVSSSEIDESRRLQELYAQMSEDELQALAADSSDLTDVAKETLRAEISNRRLDIELTNTTPVSETVEPRGDFHPQDSDLVVLHRVWDMNEARQVKQALDAAGIPSYLGPENLDDIETFKASFDGGVDMKVWDGDHQGALAVLGQALPAEPEPDDDTEHFPRCPKCHSTEIVFQSLDTSADKGTAFDSTFNWSCDACGHQWKDDGIEQET